MSAGTEPGLEHLRLVSGVCGRVAHDLNNLLAAIDGYAEFAIEGVADRPQVLSDITEVRGAAQQGARFAARLRQVGQLCEGAPEEVDLTLLVRESEEQVSLMSGERVSIEYDLGVGLPRLRVDPRQVELALLSLVQNAVEATSDGGTVRIETVAQGDDALLRVIDRGGGMSAEVRARLFEPFNSTKARALGNGLGMFIVDSVARLAGGDVEVESEEGVGTTVTVRLPAAR